MFELLLIVVFAVIWGWAGYKFAMMMNEHSQAKVHPKLSAAIGVLLGVKGLALVLCYYIVMGVIFKLNNK
jgi:uncharacterized membrane protein YsdA (DUF1294 family)